MDAFTLNSAAINGGGSFASVVLLPSSTVTVELALYERIAVSMEGTVGFALNLTGDIARVANLGAAPCALSFLFTGDLTQSRTMPLGVASSSFGLEMAGAIATVTLGPPGLSAMAITTNGALLRTGMLAGGVLTSLDSAGTLHSLRSFGAQEAGFAFALSGALRLTGFLVGATEIGIAPTGSLSVGLRSDIPPAQAELAIELAGALRLTGGLTGTTQTALTPSGTLNIGYRTPLPAAQVQWGFGLDGALSVKQHLLGSFDVGFEPAATLSSVRRISGATSMSTALMGALANNALGYDLEAVLMVRPENIREMTR